MSVAEDFAAELRQRLDGKGGMPSSMALDLGDDGYIRLDVSQTPVVINHERAPSAVTIQISPAYLRKVLDKELTIQALMFTGRAKVKDNAMMAIIFNMII
jgi:hypothetical protein